MQDLHPAPSRPRPIEGGRPPQLILEYIGGGSSKRYLTGRKSGRKYTFGNDRGHKHQYVLLEDVPHFASRVDLFVVVEEGRIDPEAERILQVEHLQLEVSRTRQVVAQLMERKDESPKSSKRKGIGGRPSGKSIGSLLVCLLTCGGLAETHGSSRLAYNAIHSHMASLWPDFSDLPRDRYPAARNLAETAKKKLGRCPWHRHPETVPEALTPL